MSFISKLKENLGFSGKEKKSIQADDFINEILEDEVIEPVRYEIILIRPQSIEDMDYIHDQVVEGNNPVIVDFSYLEEEGIDTFQMAGGKINILRQEHDAESILLCNTSEKNIVLIAPPRINIVKME